MIHLVNRIFDQFDFDKNAGSLPFPTEQDSAGRYLKEMKL